jgi:hypothetical protein
VVLKIRLLYYYRGLAREYQGGGGEFDFEEGARLEAAGKRGLGLRNGIGDALARIQGHTRVKLEKARRDARVAAEQQALLMRQAREAAGDVPPPPVVPERAPVVPSVDPTDPFGGTTTEDVPPSAEPATEPEVDSEANPFDDDPIVPADDAPTGDAPADPFGGDADTPPADPFGTDAGTPPADDPFGGDAGTPPADDPFGTDPAPAGDAGATDSGLSNPFGD